MRGSHDRIAREVPDVEVAMDKAPTISTDFMYLYDKGEYPTLVSVDNERGRVWSYALKDKSVLGGDGWLQRRIRLDIDNVGYKEVKLMINSDQKHAVVALQNEFRVPMVNLSCLSALICSSSPRQIALHKSLGYSCAAVALPFMRGTCRWCEYVE